MPRRRSDAQAPRPAVEPFMLRVRDVAAFLGVSERQIFIWVREGILNPVRIPGLRAVRFTREAVERLARKWAGESETTIQLTRQLTPETATLR